MKDSNDKTTRTPIMTDKERDHILKLVETGLDASEIGEMFGRSVGIVRMIKRVYDAVKAGDMEEAKRIAMTSKNSALYEWACVKNGVDPNPQESAPATEPKHPKQDHDSPVDVDAVVDAVLAADNKAELRMDKLLAKLDQLAVIIQSCAANPKEAMNTNTDVIKREQIKHTETLNGIKVNTKSRFGNQIR